MSRWIDAEALKDTHYNYATGELVPLAWADIENAPSIDIVRCTECKHWRNKYGDSACMLMDAWIDADDFCSRGEREGE